MLVYFIKDVKKDNYEIIDMSSFTGSNKFWKTVKPIFGSKTKSNNSINLVKGTNIIQKEGQLTKAFNEFFC